jgi:hypothetical protein
MFLLAGMALFLGLGAACAIGLAVIDDRLYRPSDFEALGVAVLGDIPAARAVKLPKPSPRAASEEEAA